MLYAVVLDFEGGLAKTHPQHYEAYRQVLALEGIELGEADYYAKYLGFDDRAGFRAVLTDYGREASDEKIDQLIEAKSTVFPEVVDRQPVLFDAAVHCVTRLRSRVPLAIASGALREDIEVVLRGTPIADSFDVIVGAGPAVRSKPAPDPYARAVALLQQHGLVPDEPDAPERCVAIEDSRWGIQSARAAGLACIAVTTSYRAPELAEANLVVDTLDEVTVDTLTALVVPA
jgi:beta-phosphoglucomutase